MIEEKHLATVEKILFLKSVDIFAHASIEELGRIALLTQEVSFPAGETIIRRGEPVDAIYLVLKGRVAVENKAKIRELGEKEAFATVAALDLEPAAHTVKALVPVTLSSSTPSIFMRSSPKTTRWCAPFFASSAV